MSKHKAKHKCKDTIKECEHCLHHCKKCDVVYCCKCDMEWNKNYITWTYPDTDTTPSYPFAPIVTYSQYPDVHVEDAIAGSAVRIHKHKHK